MYVKCLFDEPIINRSKQPALRFFAGEPSNLAEFNIKTRLRIGPSPFCRHGSRITMGGRTAICRAEWPDRETETLDHIMRVQYLFISYNSIINGVLGEKTFGKKTGRLMPPRRLKEDIN